MASQHPAVLHIISQVESNIQFLVSHNYIPHSDASAFLSKLQNTANDLRANANYVAPRAPAPPAPRPVLTPRVAQARALWGYNENGQEPNDLSFSEGDIIEIIEETNADWWLGRVNGKQAVFPSNYVEKIQAGSRAVKLEKPAYLPFSAAHHGADAPPPPGVGFNTLGLQQDAGTDSGCKQQ